MADVFVMNKYQRAWHWDICSHLFFWVHRRNFTLKYIVTPTPTLTLPNTWYCCCMAHYLLTLCRYLDASSRTTITVYTLLSLVGHTLQGNQHVRGWLGDSRRRQYGLVGHIGAFMGRHIKRRNGGHSGDVSAARRVLG